MKLGVVELEVYSDSQLVVSQVEGIFEVRDPRMEKYLKLVQSLQASFGLVKVSLISRGSNRHADSLANLASSMGDCIPRIILVESLELQSIDHPRCVAATSTASPSWMVPNISFIFDKTLLSEKKEAETIQRNSARFWLSAEKGLY